MLEIGRRDEQRKDEVELDKVDQALVEIERKTKKTEVANLRKREQRARERSQVCNPFTHFGAFLTFYLKKSINEGLRDNGQLVRTATLSVGLLKHPTHSFRDPNDPLQPQAENLRFENDSDISRLNRGQLCSYAATDAGSQFQVHTFTLSTCGRSARFIRWDRSGATVTRSFHYIKEPHILAYFF